MSTFRHTPNDIIYFDSDSMPLSFFLTQEATYALPAGMTEQRYISGVSYKASDNIKEVSYAIPNATIAGYITNKTTYVANYAAYVAAQTLPQTLAAAKLYQISLLSTYRESLRDLGIILSGIIYQASQLYYARWKNEHDYALRASALLGSYYLADILGAPVSMGSVAQLTGIIDDIDEYYWILQQNYDAHVTAINLLGTIGAVLAYDYTTGWPITPYSGTRTFYAPYSATINATFCGGTGTGTAFGGAAIASGYLDLAHADARYVSYDGTSNVDSAQVGFESVVIKPNYSGTPASDQVFISIAKANADSTNLIQITHKITTGQLNVTIKDSSDVSIVSINFGVWAPTAGTDYKIAFHWDLTVGANVLRINDVQFGTTNTATGTRSTAVDLLRVGSGYNSGAAETSNFKVKLLDVSST
jgi:hypothetical protein